VWGSVHFPASIFGKKCLKVQNSSKSVQNSLKKVQNSFIFVQNILEIVQNPLKSVQNFSATKKCPFLSLFYWEKVDNGSKPLEKCSNPADFCSKPLKKCSSPTQKSPNPLKRSKTFQPPKRSIFLALFKVM
jgi:hypothetical protein